MKDDTQSFLVDESPRSSPVPVALRGFRALYGMLGVVAPWLAVRMAARMFLRPGRHPAPRRERAWGREAEHVHLRAHGREIAGYRWGTGPTVLLVHGWAGRGLQMGAFAAPLVSAGFSALAVDLPAHGKSRGRATNGFVCGRVLSELSESIADLHAVVAHSFGGSCFLYAMSKGLRLPRVAFISPGVTTDTFFDGFSDIIGLPQHLTHRLRSRITAQFASEDWSCFEVAATGDALREQAGEVLVLHDAHDEEVAFEGIAELVDRSGATLLRTRGLGHRRVLRNDRVIEAVIAFVAGEH